MQPPNLREQPADWDNPDLDKRFYPVQSCDDCKWCQWIETSPYSMEYVDGIRCAKFRYVFHDDFVPRHTRRTCTLICDGYEAPRDWFGWFKHPCYCALAVISLALLINMFG